VILFAFKITQIIFVFFIIKNSSINLQKFENIAQTNHEHLNGDLVMFTEIVTAIGGRSTSMVEVYDGKVWNDQRIPPIGNNKYGNLLYFTSLAINSDLFLFGKI